MRLTVLGTGYLGSVHAAVMADIGHEVLGVDVDPDRIAALRRGRAPFFEPDFAPLLDRTLKTGRLSFTTSLVDAARFGDVHFVCVGTPQLPGSRAADLRYVHAVVDGLAPHLSRPCLVVGKSTVPVGTAEWMAARVAALAPAARAAEVAWNPEFLREGFAVADTRRPDRIVVGATSARAEETLRAVYAPMLAAGTPYLRTDLPTAELVKASANAFLATKISFSNAMAEVCAATGADVVALAQALGHDERIGRRFLSAGLGFGGGCLPKDIRAFVARAEELGAGEAIAFLREVDAVNVRCRHRTVELAGALLGERVTGKRIAVLGAAFKPDSDDVRDSPALDVAAALHRRGALVRVHDPEALDNARAVCPDLEYTTDVDKALETADLVLHTTEWRQYGSLDPVAAAAVVRTPLLLDARNTLDADRWRAAGWTVRGLGRPAW